MTNTPRTSTPTVAKLEQLRAESEAARLALCKASAACEAARKLEAQANSGRIA
jgi:hypothetical protein